MAGKSGTKKSKRPGGANGAERGEGNSLAGMMGIATGTTKAQLHRARRMLREVLA